MQTAHSNELKFSFVDWLKYLNRISLRRLLHSIISKNSTKHSRRFELHSPTYSKQQIIYDTEKNQKFSVHIRDKVDYMVIVQMFYFEDYQLKYLARYPDLHHQYTQSLSEGKTPVIIDIGANSGMASIYFSIEFPESKIIAIEPDKANFQLAKLNSSAQQNIHVLNAGISSEVGRGKIINAGAENWALKTELSDDGELEMISVNSIMNEHFDSSDVPFIVKIDIEGFESNLFSSATDWVNKFPLLIIELHDWMLPGVANSSAFLKCISKLNRDFVYKGENIFSIKNN